MMCPVQASLKPVPGLPAGSLHRRLSEGLPRKNCEKEGLLDSIWQSTGIMLRFCRKTRMSSTLPSVATMRMGHSAWKSRHPLLIIKLQSKKTGSIRVVNKYGLFHFIFKHGQVSANFDLLLKWFTVFGRDTPTGTELQACPAQCMKILNFQWLLWCML